MDKNWRPVRAERLRQVNCLVILISSVGRLFFKWARTVDFMEMDARGRLWWNQRWNEKRLYLHGPGTVLRRGFSHGGTLRELVLCFRSYVLTGTQIPSSGLDRRGYPGGLWGYGDDMQLVRDTARALGILAEEERAVGEMSPATRLRRAIQGREEEEARRDRKRRDDDRRRRSKKKQTQETDGR